MSKVFPTVSLPRSLDKAGFTLIELLVVISIIAVIATIGVVTYNGLQQSARDTKRKEDLDAIKKALYVLSSTQSNNQFCSGSESGTVSYNTTDAGLIAKLVPSFMPSIPKDPTNSTTDYLVYLDCTNNNFILSAKLEGTIPANLPCNPNPSGSGRNYCITN